MVKSVEGNITPLGVRHDMVEAIWEKTKPHLEKATATATATATAPATATAAAAAEAAAAAAAAEGRTFSDQILPENLVTRALAKSAQSLTSWLICRMHVLMFFGRCS